MDSERIKKIVTALNGLNASEWSRVKRIIDMNFSSKVAKVQLDDSEHLKRGLEVEFNLRRFGEMLD